MCNWPRLLLAAMPCVAGLTLAQEFPAKAIRYVVPSAPGGSSDTLARVMAPRLGEWLGQQMLIDNCAGVTGVIGTEIVVLAPVDGRTLLQAATSHAINPATGVKLPYDIPRDFAPITLLSQQPNLWVVHPSLPAKDIKSLVSLARKKPGHLDFASSSKGGSQHLAGEWLNMMVGIKLTYVP